MNHRTVVLTAAAAVLSVTVLPAPVTAEDVRPAGSATDAAPGSPAGPLSSSLVLPTPSAGLAVGFGGASTASTATTAPAGPDGTTVQAPPAIYAMTGASGAPAINSRTPARHATNVSRTANIKVRFTKAVRASTIVIRLRDYVKGTYIAGKLTYASATRTAAFNPTPTLGSHRKYVVVVSGAKDSAGHIMAKSTWSFTTRP